MPQRLPQRTACRALGLLTAGIVLAGLGACTTTRSSRDPGAVAAAYAEQGRWPEAQREIELAVRREPRDAGLRYQAAQIHRQAGNQEAALGHLELLVTDLAPGEAEAWIEIGELERERENLQDAYVAYRRASQLAPDDVRAVRGLALAADGLGFEEEAERAYARWRELDEDGAPGGN